MYRNAWVRLREDRVIRPDGGPGIYSVLELRPSVGIVVLDGSDRLGLVGQWRYPHDKFTWEIPRGGSRTGETDMLAAAERELREEAGLAARRWQRLGEVDVNNGVTDDTQHLFLATELEPVPAAQDPEEQITLRWAGFPEAVEMALSGEITECCSVAAILKVDALRRLGRIQRAG